MPFRQLSVKSMELIEAKSSNKKIISYLQDRKVLVLPTDTIYGLSCLISKKEAIEKIYTIKERPKEKSFIILCSDLKMVRKYFSLNNFQEEVLHRFVSDPFARATTFILQPKKDLIRYLNVDGKKGVAMRLPKSIFLSKIISEINIPLISTSCNLSGQESLNNLKKIFSFFKKRLIQPDAIVKLNGYLPKRRASRIIDILEDDNLKIIRN